MEELWDLPFPESILSASAAGESPKEGIFSTEFADNGARTEDVADELRSDARAIPAPALEGVVGEFKKFANDCKLPLRRSLCRSKGDIDNEKVPR